jgi:hypothetical protein
MTASPAVQTRFAPLMQSGAVVAASAVSLLLVEASGEGPALDEVHAASKQGTRRNLKR